MAPERALPLIEEEMVAPSSNTGYYSNYEEVEKSQVQQLDGTDAEWKYRGRVDSEYSEAQPIGAPAGLSAQKDEGFQRFYKAVVSPTHVRVTAGGRIVPNNRVSTSPTTKSAKEKTASDGPLAQQSDGRTVPEFGQLPVSPAHFGPFGHMVPGFMHPGHPALPASPPFGMMPWQMGVRIPAPFGFIPTNAAQLQAIRAAPKSSAASVVSEKHGDNAAATSERAIPVRLSPPEQFDNSKPCFFNGQMLMPGANAFAPLQVPHMAGSPMTNVAAQAAVSPRFNMQTMLPPQPVKLGHAAQGQAVSTLIAPGFVDSTHIPISSIRPSEITRKQMEVLRTSLKYFEDQLQYNKHQIDERITTSQAGMVRQQIDLFEGIMKHQLVEERALFPRLEREKETDSSAVSEPAVENASLPTKQHKLIEAPGTESSSHGSAARGGKPKANTLQEPNAARVPSATKSLKAASAPVSARISPESSEDCGSVRKLSALPVSAALAPPFQPRSNSITSASVPDSSSGRDNSSTDATRRAMQPAQRISDFSSSDTNVSRPYLVGTLQRSGNKLAAGDDGYMYGRDLTEDELRARHMYWGNAPRHLQKGLPKFDRKDFYPPSPVKDQPKQRVEPSKYLHNGAAGRPEEQLPSGVPKINNGSFRSLGRSSHRAHRSNMRAATQSEHLPKVEQAGKGATPSISTASGRSYDDFRKALVDTSDSTRQGSSERFSEDGDDGSNLLFKGRNYKPPNM